MPLQELQCFVAAAARDQHKALVHMYFGYRATKKLRGAHSVPGVLILGAGGVGGC